MRFVIQRVSSASVVIDEKIVAQIPKGLLVLCGFHSNDSSPDFLGAAKKILEMRIFTNSAGRFDLSVQDIQGGVILVPQFTLFANTEKGRRPDFFEAQEPKLASQNFDQLVATFKNYSLAKFGSGVFGTDMKVSLCNDGPVTIVLDW